MSHRLSPNEWRNIFPTIPETVSARTGDPKEELLGVDVITAVFLPTAWAGIDSLAEPIKPEQIFSRSGRWFVTANAILCANNAYDIARHELDREHWIAQLSQKSWLYDPSDLLDAYEAARKIFRPRESEQEREMIVNDEIDAAIRERLEFPFKSSRALMGRHVYLPSKMNELELNAFCEYLSTHLYIPRFK
jgi:hypothetical protein